MADLTDPCMRQAIRVFAPGEGSRGLDAGCGRGRNLDRLAREVGSGGYLTAFDISQENLALAGDGRELAGAEAATIDFVRGDIRNMPFDSGVFDWVFCVDTLWPGATVDDPVPALLEFRRVTRPGGKVALVYWSGQTLLPGYPVLEARLNAAFVEVVPYLAGVAPERHFLRAGDWLRSAGVGRPYTRTFLTEIRHSSTPEAREALAACFTMLWDEAAKRLSEPDRATYERLCRPDSPDFIADLPGYYGLITYTMFWGRLGPSA